MGGEGSEKERRKSSNRLLGQGSKSGLFPLGYESLGRADQEHDKDSTIFYKDPCDCYIETRL